MKNSDTGPVSTGSLFGILVRKQIHGTGGQQS